MAKKIVLNQVLSIYEAEKNKLIKKLKPYYKEQEYAKAKQFQDKLNLINEFIKHLKIIKKWEV
jgi:hypothetical protein